MTKEEFLIQLKESLEGQVSSDNLVETMAYYQSYFQEEENNGKSENDIITFLGNPRLIAHSIIDAEEEANGGKEAYYDVESDRFEEDGSLPMEEKMNNLAVKMKTILGIVLVVVVVGALLNLLLPAIIIIAIILGISHFLRKL